MITPATATQLGGVTLTGALGGSTNANLPTIPNAYVTAAMLAQAYAAAADLTTEINRATAAESSITSGYEAAVNAEITARQAADANEAGTRANADAGLQTSINSVSANVTTTNNNLATEIANRQTAITNEATARTGGDNTNATNITANATAINNEVSRATAAENARLLKANNLSDLANVATARTNLGLGSAATQASTAFDASGAAATVQTNLNSEITNRQAANALALKIASNLSDLNNPATARTNLGLGSAATQPSTNFATASALSNEITRATNAEAIKATDSLVVHLASSETITGNKNFTGGVSRNNNSLVDTTDSRLSDTRNPKAASVSDASVIAGGLTNAALSPTAAIARTKLDAGIQTSLGKADTAVQTVNGLTGPAITLTSSSLGTVAGYNPTAVKTANYTALPQDLVLADISTGSFTITLPNAPADRTLISVEVIASAAPNNLTIQATGGALFNRAGGLSIYTLSIAGQRWVGQYQASTNRWLGLDSLTLAASDNRYDLLGSTNQEQTRAQQTEALLATIGNGFTLATYHATAAIATGTPIAGTLYLAKVNAAVTSAVTNIWFNVATAGSGSSTGSYLGMYNVSNGMRLSDSPDIGTLLTSTGPHSIAINIAQSIAPPASVWLALLINMPTMPVLSTSGAPIALLNANTTAATGRFVVGGTGLTNLPAGSLTTTNNTFIGAMPFWMATS